jgi:hypothetical protein
VLLQALLVVVLELLVLMLLLVRLPPTGTQRLR